MKLRNKKTGKVIEWFNNTDGILPNTLAELNKEWEDYKNSPYVIDMWEDNCICDAKFGVELEGIKRAKECGLYFETKEEAEKAVEKLKAWKRLKDKGFKVDLWDYDGGNYQERIKTGRILFRVKDYEENDKDLDLLFGGEE